MNPTLYNILACFYRDSRPTLVENARSSQVSERDGQEVLASEKPQESGRQWEDEESKGWGIPLRAGGAQSGLGAKPAGSLRTPSFPASTNITQGTLASTGGYQGLKTGVSGFPLTRSFSLAKVTRTIYLRTVQGQICHHMKSHMRDFPWQAWLYSLFIAAHSCSSRKIWKVSEGELHLPPSLELLACGNISSCFRKSNENPGRNLQMLETWGQEVKCLVGGLLAQTPKPQALAYSATKVITTIRPQTQGSTPPGFLRTWKIDSKNAIAIPGQAQQPLG